MGLDDRYWDPIGDCEAAAVLGEPVRITASHRRWLFAVARCLTGTGEVMLKRQPPMGRRSDQLEWQHRLTNHVADSGVPAARALGITELAGFWYETFEVAAGADRYAGTDSWEPFATLADAHAAGATLARLHAAADGFEPRRAQPQAGFVVQLGMVPRGAESAVEKLCRLRPAVADHLAHREWRAAVAAAYDEPFSRLESVLHTLPESPLHGDWQTNNLFFDEHGVSGVIDFHQADFGPRILDLAVAVERNCFFWNRLSAGERGAYDLEHAAALTAGYESATPLQPAERAAFADVLGCCQFEYGISFLDYYWGVERDREKADWAWDTFVLGHARWWQGGEGREVRAEIERMIGAGGRPAPTEC
ncbi:MAG TPA: phosphotransferase [Gaiellales bacterium]|nr:phosphotransferase [Gaiellales bacterium]